MLIKTTGTPKTAMSFSSLEKGTYERVTNASGKGGNMMVFVPSSEPVLTSLGMAVIRANKCDIIEPFHTANYSRFRDYHLPCFPVAFRGPLKDFWYKKKENQKYCEPEDYYSNTSNLSQNGTNYRNSLTSNKGILHA